MKDFLKKKWMWFAYISMFAALISYRAFTFFGPSQQAHLYYKIYMIMSVNINHFAGSFVFAIATFILGGFTIIFLCLYLLEKKVFSIPFILVIIIARIICDIFGHSYEWSSIRAIYFQSHLTAWNDGLNLFFWLLPSYLAMGDYVWKKIKDQRPMTNERRQESQDQ